MRAALHALMTRLSRKVWLAAYDLEVARESHATARRYVRSAACCMGLAALTVLESFR